MAFPTYQTTARASWSANFPFSLIGLFDATGCDCVVVYFITAGTYAFTPTCSIDGNSATFVGQYSTANSGTIWGWITTNFTPGFVSYALDKPDQFVDNGRLAIVGFSGVNPSSPLGGSNFNNASGTPADATVSFTLQSSSSLVAVHSYAYFTAGVVPTEQASNPAFVSIQSDTTNPDIANILGYQTSSGAGNTASSTWRATFNACGAGAIEVQGVSGGGGGSSVPKFAFIGGRPYKSNGRIIGF